MFSFTKKSFSFKVYITGNREFLPRKPQICLIHSSKLQDKFSVSHCEIQISPCETENKQGRLKEYFRRKERITHLPPWILHLKNKKEGYMNLATVHIPPFIEIVNYRL